ncbi:MAG: DUF202 domain-containing protein [Pseudonocardia sp.]|nr:DUF202 domain-containing protein [Pseudonocardia sp.]
MTGPALERRLPGDGLQPERTALSWSRTSLGFLANGALLLLRDAQHYSGPLRLLPAVLALALAVVVYGFGRARLHTLRHKPLPAPLAARRQTMVIGWSMITLTIATAILLGL